jgi:hypothetical protein
MITTIALRAVLLARRLHRALQYYRKLRYTWHLSWVKAGWQA